MPVRMLNFVSTPPPRRTHSKDGHIMRTKEWQDAVMGMGAGLKPAEYIELFFLPEDDIYKHMKHPLHALKNSLKNKIKALDLPYDVYERNKKLYIVGRGVPLG